MGAARDIVHLLSGEEKYRHPYKNRILLSIHREALTNLATAEPSSPSSGW
jgi:hypothetical protein